MTDDTDYTRSSPLPRRARWYTEAVFNYCDKDGQLAFHLFRETAQIGANRPVINERTRQAAEALLAKVAEHQ